MERIQSAISKARAAREGKIGTPPAEGTVRPATAAPATAEPAPPGAWERLQEVAIQPQTLARNRIVTNISSPAATPFDVIRTRLLQQMRGQGWKRVGITSPDPACGKTMMCLNLAFSLARRPELRTVVLEIDLRRPSMERTLGLPIQQQFSKVLEGQDDLDRHLTRVRGMNLAIATNHSPVRNSAEILHAPSAEMTLAEVERRYSPDITIIDLPPTQVGDDVMAFARWVDCVLIVAAAGATTIVEVDQCERELASQTNVLGVVLNKCRYLDKHQSYDYYG